MQTLLCRGQWRRRLRRPITEERHLRIDYVLYQSASLSLTGVGHVPKLTMPIPDARHPSDHLPVSARLLIKPHWAQVEEDARQWLAAVSGTTSVRPLSGDALRLAFTYFDKDATGQVSLVQLEAGMQVRFRPCAVSCSCCAVSSSLL